MVVLWLMGDTRSLGPAEETATVPTDRRTSDPIETTDGDDPNRLRRWQEATTAIITKLLKGAGTDEVLTDIATVAYQLAGADECGVRLADPDGRSLKLTAAAGIRSTRAVGEEMPIVGTFLGAVYSTGTSASTPDLASVDPDDTLVRSRGVGPVLAVALITPQRTIGTLSLSRYQGRAPFNPSDLDVVESFAGQAALAIAYGQTHELHERMALNDDRERIARDLHDLVIQRVFAAGLTLQAAATMLDDGPAKERVTRVVDELDDTIAELRTTIFALQQTGQQAPNLRLRITELVQGAEPQLGFVPRLRINGEIGTRVDPEVADHLLAVVREAIANAARHAGATRLHVTIDVGRDLGLVVEDDGRGLPEQPGRRSGLANMARRADELGGTFVVDRGDLGGARLRWTVPLDSSH